MSLDIQWDHQFCLACDKQTDGATYCSESCRLADYEKTSSPSGTGASSPALAGLSSYAWSFTETASNGNKFYLSPAFNISSASVQQQQQQQPTTLQTTSQASTGLPNRLLSTSSSYSSLSSMGSTVSQQSTSTFHLSDKARRELQAYASSFEQVRLQRRRSY